MDRDPLEIGRKMDALGLWSRLEPYNFAVKPKGTVFPYFCTVLKGERPVKVRFLMLEGWQTLHDYVRTRIDRNFGFYSSPIELPHFELVVLESGEMKLFRHDTGYMPVETDAARHPVVASLLWEAYGIMLRMEGDGELPIKYVSEQAVFARVETASGVWEDRPLEVPSPPPHVEQVSFPKADLQKAKDIPFVREDVLHVDFALKPDQMTKEPRPRSVYRLLAIDPKDNSVAIDLRASLTPGIGLRGLWETMPQHFLKALIARGRIPGEVKVASGRVFRMLRPLCLELPFKLSMHDELFH